MKINNQIVKVFLSVILLFGINGIILGSMGRGAGVQDAEAEESLKDDGTKTIALISPRPLSEVILEKLRKNEEYEVEKLLKDGTGTIIIGNAEVDKDGKIIQYSIDTDDSERKKVFIAHIIFEPKWRYIPILIGFLRDPDTEVVHKADKALVIYTVVYYDYGTNSPHLMRDKNKTISEVRIKTWEEWYNSNKDTIPETIPMEDRIKKSAQIAPTEKELKESEDRLLKNAKEDVNDPGAGLIIRAVSSKILRGEGDYDGPQAILPEILKFRDLLMGNFTYKEQEMEMEKIIQSYKSSKERKLAKIQLINLIESSRESIRLKKTAMIMALTMKKYFTSNEIKSLIENVPELDLKLLLIKLLGEVGNINDVSFFLSLADSNDKKIKVQVLNTLSHMSIIKKWLNINEVYVSRYNDRDSIGRMDHALGRWTSWWEEQQNDTNK